MNNITKYLLVFISLVAISFAVYYYFKFQGVQNDVLDVKEKAEEQRLKLIDSLTNDIEKRDSDILFLIDYSDSLKEVIKNRINYVPNNDDVDNANPTELEQLLSRYYN